MAAAAPSPASRPRRRAWPWVLLVVVVLAVVLAVAAEALSRSLVQSTVRQLVTSELDLAPDHDVAVDVPGLVLPQLIGGTLEEISVSSDDVTIGPLTGSVAATLTHVPVRGDGPAGRGTATVRLDETQLRSLLRTVEGLPADTVGLDAPDVTISTELSVFGARIPVGVALRPGVADGELVLTPQAFQVGGADVSAETLRERFGGIAGAVVKDWRLCIAQFLPAALTLTGLEVDRDAAVARFDVDGSVVTSRDTAARGTCA